MKGKRTGNYMSYKELIFYMLFVLTIFKQVKFPHLSFGDTLRIPSHITESKPKLKIQLLLEVIKLWKKCVSQKNKRK